MSARERTKWMLDMYRILGPAAAFELISATNFHDEWIAANRQTEGLMYKVSHEEIPVTQEEDEFLTELTSRQAAGGTLHAAKRETQAERLERQAKEALHKGLPPEEVNSTPPTSDPHYAVPPFGRTGRHDLRPHDVSAAPEDAWDNNLDVAAPTDEEVEIDALLDDSLEVPIPIKAYPITNEQWHARLTEGEKRAKLAQIKRDSAPLIRTSLRPSAGMGRGFKQREGDQVLPEKNNSTPIQHLVLKDILERMDVGYKRYGTYLQANNGRDVLQDAYEEALDLAIYLRQALEERNA